MKAATRTALLAVLLASLVLVVPAARMLRGDAQLDDLEDYSEEDSAPVPPVAANATLSSPPQASNANNTVNGTASASGNSSALQPPIAKGHSTSTKADGYPGACANR